MPQAMPQTTPQIDPRTDPRTFSGSSDSPFLRDGSVYALLARQAGRFADHDLFVLPEAVRALWDEGQNRWSYGAALAEIDALSARFAAAGIGRGDRVALLLENRPAHFLTWLALNRLGGVMVPVNPQASAEEIGYLLSHSEARLLIRLPKYAGTADPVAAGLGLPALAPGDPLPQIRQAAPAGGADLEGDCALIYTSGSTGKPKGCLLSNRYFLNWATWYSAQGGAISLRQGQERLMTPLPTFHVNSTGHSFLGMLSCGGAQIIIDRFHPRSWWRDAIDCEATCFHYLGVMPAILLELPEAPEDRGHKMRYGLGGGVHPDHHARFEARFGVPLLEGWAMTETGGAGTFCTPEEPRHVGSRCIGRPDRPGPALQIRLVDEEGQEVPRGTPGELLLRAAGDNPREGFFSGYLKDPEATEAAWAGGWLHTGDVMRQGADGSLFFVERRKNIIRRSGENIAAAEVELAIQTVPGVSAVAVLPTPDPLRDEEVLAVVVPTAEAGEDAALAQAILETCAARLTYFKVPGYIVFQDSLPTTSTQKVRKPALRQLAADPLAAPRCIDLREQKQALR
ncbi:AMP-binding protein [Pseudodonghicola flavimaris]|uniref:AMP-binding protein n=1 Tax=Pseudodonghicola flavimaris TaxID=3050036 RepID=A0ABT7F814_9RHOB|nr:AMP-binding protein [Pseudodonghicola flavimaris]MDK3020736.1 AMP-binding protein [Pseudodonghicola flavimaris]